MNDKENARELWDDLVAIRKKIEEFGGTEIEHAQIIAQRVQNSLLTEKLRAKWKIPAGGFPDGIKGRDHWINGMNRKDSKLWDKEFAVFMARLGIARAFYFTVEDAVFFNECQSFQTKLDLPDESFEVFINRNQYTGLDELLIRVDQNVKRRELFSEKTWSKIDFLRKKLPDVLHLSQRRLPRIKLLEQMYKWHFKDGLSYREIAKRLKKSFPENSEFAYDEQNVGKYIQRYKKIVGIRTREK